MLPLIFIMPIFQLIILVNAATFEMKNIKMVVIDNDLSSTSRGLLSKFDGSPFFKIIKYTFSEADADNEIKNNKADVIIEIPNEFEKKLVKENHSKLQLRVNAINGSTAGLIYAYSSNVIADYNRQIIIQNMSKTNIISQQKMIDVTYTHWYNPQLNYKTFMVPGILALLVTLIGMMLSGMNVVREKEIGTIEQINVTPIKKYQFIVGKLMPFWIIALFELAFGLTIGKLIFDIPMIGSIGLVFFVASVYLLVVLGLGLLVSTLVHTQQQAMLISFFFMMIFILMSGLFTAIENMPHWAITMDRFNPVAYFIRILRMILLKGSGFADISNDFYSLVVLAIVSLSLAVWRYRKIA